MLGSLPEFRRRLLKWYIAHRRDLPWRVPPGAPRGTLPDPYRVLVSEAMLQQTQVATVVPYFDRFMRELPTLADLAAADPQHVLRLWQGLGYYSRARKLQAAAIAVMQDFRGQVPCRVEDLLQLPGVGPYTAGAIASLAFDQRARILDGNVTRVLCRLDCLEADPRSPAARQLLWQRAEQILPSGRCGDFNSAIMELGATVCTARAPKCLICPVRAHCKALATGRQEQVPPTAPAKVRPTEHRWTFCIRGGTKWLIEQRPPRGRWAGMWQFVTLPAGQNPRSVLRSHIPSPTSHPRKIGSIAHELTHRRYQFDIYRCDMSEPATAGIGSAGPARRWVELQGLSDYPLPRPHLRIAAMLTDGTA